MRTSIIFSYLFSLVILYGPPQSFAQTVDVGHRVFVLGNTTDISLHSPFYASFSKLLQSSDPFTVVINGDLINSETSKEPSTTDSLKIDKLLRSITEANNGKAVIIPGDRDWANSGKKGLKSVLKLEKLVKSMDFDNVDWAIGKGCPGPDAIELSDDLILISVNTQWWNQPYDRPDASTAECKISTERDFLIEMENLVEGTEDKNILVAGHYPLESLGEYGGNFPIEKHLFPPIVGSFVVGYHKNIGTSRDIANERFDPIRKKIENILQHRGSVIYAAGHEHNLQVLRANENYVINSGSPTKAKYVAKNKETAAFAESIPGMVELVYYSSGKVDYRIHEFTSSNTFKLNTQETLYSTPCDDAGGKSIFNTTFNPCEKASSESLSSTDWGLDTTLIAGDYSTAGFNKFLLGKHYRTTWNAPVKVPYLDLQNTLGGLTVYEKGGGHQTTSLNISGADGREYAFRSVDKNPVQLLPYELQGTVIARVMQDITSMQQPYGAMAVGALLDATDILHARPKLYMKTTIRDGAYRRA